MRNDLNRELTAADAGIQYDAQCKRVLGQKVILAWILRRTVGAFADMDIDSICGCIEGEPEISTVRVNPGETNSGRVEGLSTEDKVPEEGVIYYDIRFRAYEPGKTGYIKVIVNVEAQKSFYPGYEIVTRGIFYAARMISAQLGTEFTASEYNKLKKVYTIWLCMDAPKKIGNAISEYHFFQTDLVPGIPDKKEAYDKMSIVVIALNQEMEAGDKFLRMLNTLLSPEINVESKKEALQEEFQISMEGQIGKELDLMCNLSGYVEKKGIEQTKVLMVSNMLKQGYERMEPFPKNFLHLPYLHATIIFGRMRTYDQIAAAMTARKGCRIDAYT